MTKTLFTNRNSKTLTKTVKTTFGAAILSGILCFGATNAIAQKTSTTPPPVGTPAKPSTSKIKPYDEVITKNADTKKGVFFVHKVEDKYYFEVPDSLLERDMLIVSKISGYVENLSFGGAGSAAKSQQMVRFAKQGNQIILKHISTQNVASEDLPIYKSVKANNFSPVIAAFDILAINKDTTARVIDVTPLFTTDVTLLAALDDGQRKQFQVSRLDNTRSYVSQAKSFPKNMVVKHVLTYVANKPPANEESGTLSLEMTQSFILLAKYPSMPRLADKRAGFFSVNFTDYGSTEHQADEVEYITRWKLEPKDKEAYLRGELVEPVKQIVYYIDPATPMEWRPFLKQGIEDWQKAFEKAGFKNAIIAKDAPTPQEDPDFDPDDSRYSCIRYITTKIQNAVGPHVHDPRSGEIIESDILWYHNIMSLLRNWMVVQASQIVPELQTGYLSKDMMGLGLRFVMAHEVGHTLGFPHNMGSSYAHPVDSLRSTTFTDKYGVAPSIMDYARFNYVAQPKDKINRWYPSIGVYDNYITEWGYRWYPNVKKPEDELPQLNAMIMKNWGNPMYWYGRQTFNEIDPRSTTESVGDDAMKASNYGIENLKRIVPQLVKWTKKENEDFEELKELYTNVFGQWNRYSGHVYKNIGGVYETFRMSTQEGVVYQAVEKEKQQKAMKYLAEQVFATPTWMLDENILRKIENAGIINRIRAAQVATLNDVLEFGRLARLIECETRFGKATSYTMGNLFTDLRKNIWSELAAGKAVDTYRRNLQRAYLERMEFLMTQEQTPLPAAFEEYREFFGLTSIDASQSDIRAYTRGELKTLQGEVKASLLKYAGNQEMNYHLQDVLQRIENILNPKK